MYICKCIKCQLFSPFIHQLARDLTPLTSPWLFSRWGMDILGVLPQALGNKKIMLAAMDYFTKWVEVEPLAQIREVDIIKFIYRNILSPERPYHITECSSRATSQDLRDRLSGDICPRCQVQYNLCPSHSCSKSRLAAPST